MSLLVPTIPLVVINERDYVNRVITLGDGTFSKYDQTIISEGVVVPELTYGTPLYCIYFQLASDRHELWYFATAFDRDAEYDRLLAEANECCGGADGKSAYEVAVDNGFVGTEVDWLASLQGTTGPTGPTGATGPPGSGGDKNYIHDQPTASSSWVVSHGLAKYPSVTIVTTSGDEVEGNVNHVDNNNLIINFNFAFGGKAYIN